MAIVASQSLSCVFAVYLMLTACQVAYGDGDEEESGTQHIVNADQSSKMPWNLQELRHNSEPHPTISYADYPNFGLTANTGSEKETEKDEDAGQLEAVTTLNDNDKRSSQLQVRGDRSLGSPRQSSRFVGRPQRTGDMAMPALARPSPLPGHGQGQDQKRASLDALIARLNRMSGVRHADNGRISLVRFGPGR